MLRNLLPMILHQMKRYMFGALLFAAASVLAAGINELPVKTVNGTTYHIYTVKQHETLYALSKRFNISEAEIIRLNPGVEDGLKAGQELLLGKASTSASTSQSETYLVKKSDTAYGISKRFDLPLEEFYTLNPTARDGVKEGQVVIVKSKRTTDSVEKKSSSAKASSTSATRTHVIGEHETLYQIARDNNVPLAELLAANPGLDAARYSSGTEIVIPASAKPATSTAANQTSSTYKVKAGDTFYGIATRNGIDLPHLYAANPDVDILKEGMVINLPDGCDEKSEEAAVATISPAEKKPITLAVVLPFQIDQKGKHNKSMTEFFRGFLIAVDSLRSFGNPIHIQTYDTKGTSEGLQEILEKPELKNANAIIGPDNAEQLNALNAYGRDNGIYVLNLFNNRDSSYLYNPYAIQGALPREAMYDRAAKAFISSFDDYLPVFIISNDGRRDKVEFIDVVKSKLTAAGKSYKEINYTGTLALETLVNALPVGQKYAFLPGSSNKDEFDKYATAIQAYKDNRDFKNEVIVWGYPEWLANRQAYPRMHELDCYIYSRNNLPEKYETESLNNLYDTWFGPHMMQAYPQRAYMGFDAGMYLLKSLQANSGNFSGFTPYVQAIIMPLSLKRINGGGFCNDELLLINLAPGETISKRSI